MSDTTTPAERMEKTLARAQAFVKLHGHDNTACITSGELFLFRDALKCAQTEIEHWGKLYLMMTKDEQRLTKIVDWLAGRELTVDGFAAPCQCESGYFQGKKAPCGERPDEFCPKFNHRGNGACWVEAASRAVAAGEG